MEEMQKDEITDLKAEAADVNEAAELEENVAEPETEAAPEPEGAAEAAGGDAAGSEGDIAEPENGAAETGNEEAAEPKEEKTDSKEKKDDSNDDKSDSKDEWKDRTNDKTKKKDVKAKHGEAKKKKSLPRNYVLLVISLLCVLMIGSTFAMLAYFSDVIETEAINIASQYVKSTSVDVVAGLENYKSKVQTFALNVSSESYENFNDFCVRLRRLPVVSDRYGDIKFTRFFKDGVEYDSEGNLFSLSDEASAVKKAVAEGNLACVGVVEDRHYNLSVVAFCVPLERCEYADMLVVCYPVETVVKTSLDLERSDYSSAQIHAVCATRGEIVELLYAADSTNVQQHGDIFVILRNEINDKSIVDNIQKNMEEGTSATYTVTVSARPCIICVNGIKDDVNSGFSVVGYYRAEDVNKSGYFIISAVLGEFLVFFISVLVVIIVSFVHMVRTRNKIARINDINEELDCPTRYKFEKDTADIINRNKATYFAITVIDINHFEYLFQQIGASTMTGILRRMKFVYSRVLGIDETYGYEGNGRFLLMLHYRTMADLERRLKDIVMVASAQGTQLAANIQLVLMGGIYTTKSQLVDTTAKMVDLAIDAEKATKYSCDFSVFRIYNEKLHQSSVKNDYIELHMESALANRDFKVFYQPKYNIAESRIDGCEALVRWYNPELDEYMQPDEFLPLFETNRFIVKLDHYVFEQVCIYIQDSLINKVPLFPVSVNASRITATDKDFLSFYTKTKRQYNIADNFLTIEFTESFANEDYDMLRDIVTELHKVGIKCSIDDFGSGFSSYNILKELPMDEIKLDRFFIKEGYSKDRDLKVLASIVALGRDLRMKVTQEGVETEDQVNLLKRLGCQVIQGYYIAKPLTLTDYIGFISATRH